MNKQNINSKKGFTIIEVVLVLAIAGLIFLMVFIAYPALRRSQSDTQRRDDMARVLSQLATYKTNNRKMPGLKKVSTDTADQLSTGCKNKTANNASCSGQGGFIGDYLDGDKFQDPDGEPYYIMEVYDDQLFTSKNAPSEAVKPTNVPNHIIYYYTGATCEGETVVKSAGNGKNDIAIVYWLENGKYCGSTADQK